MTPNTATTTATFSSPGDSRKRVQMPQAAVISQFAFAAPLSTVPVVSKPALNDTSSSVYRHVPTPCRSPQSDADCSGLLSLNPLLEPHHAARRRTDERSTPELPDLAALAEAAPPLNANPVKNIITQLENMIASYDTYDSVFPLPKSPSPERTRERRPVRPKHTDRDRDRDRLQQMLQMQMQMQHAGPVTLTPVCQTVVSQAKLTFNPASRVDTSPDRGVASNGGGARSFNGSSRKSAGHFCTLLHHPAAVLLLRACDLLLHY